MEKWIDKIFSLKTFPGKLVFVLWFASIALIILPDKNLQWLSLLEFKNLLSLYIGPVALLTTAILIWMVSRYIHDRIITKKYIKKRMDEINHNIGSLTYNEIVLLREFYLQGNDTILIPVNNETVIALENKGIVYKATNSAIVGYDMGFPFSMTKHAKKSIIPQTLHLPQTQQEFTESLQHKIWNERPDWAKEMLRRKELFRSIW